MSNIVLSRAEVKDLCRTRLRAGQARFLQQNGIRHYIDAHGWPVVLRAHIEDAQAAAPVAVWKSNKAA